MKLTEKDKTFLENLKKLVESKGPVGGVEAW